MSHSKTHDLLNRYKNSATDKLDEPNKAYRSREIKIATEDLIRRAGRGTHPDYLKDLAVSLFEQASKLDSER